MKKRPWKLRDRGVLIPAVLGLLLLSSVFADRIVPADPQVDLQRIDHITERDVRLGLTHHAQLADEDIDVAVTGGAVRLTGEVRSQQERMAALLVATSVPSTRILIDDLRISAPE